jgi:hypothetical protein
MNLQFSQQQTGAIRITDEAGKEIYTFDPAADPVLGSYGRSYQGAILSTPAFSVGDGYLVYVDDTQMQYSSTDVMRGPGGHGPGGKPPAGDSGPGDRGPMPPPGGQMPGFPEGGNVTFYMQDKVNFFSGIVPAN